MTKIKLILLLCFFVQVKIVSAQVKIGDNPNTINGASLLELETTNKGFVFPRMALTSLSSPSPLPAGLLTGTVVFNTASGVGSGVGLYYWNGTAWVAVGTGAVSTAWSLTGNAGTSAGTNFLGTTDNVGLRFRTNNLQRMVIDSLGNVGIGSENFRTTTTREKLLVDMGTSTANTVATYTGSVNNYMQINLQNNNAGSIASADYVATANDGTDDTLYIDMGINNSGYSANPDNWGNAHDAYLYSDSRNLLIGTQAVASDVIFLVGGGRINSNAALRITQGSSNIVVGKGDSTTSPTGNIIRGPNATGTNIPGGTLTIQGGSSRGTFKGAALYLLGGSSSGTGSRGSINMMADSLYVSGIPATATLTTDSVLTISNSVVKKAPFSSFSSSSWLTTGNDNTTVNSLSFLGTKTGTSIPLLFKAQGDTVGYLGLRTSSNAVSFGIGASGVNTAVSSVAIGFQANASAGNEAVALGANAVAGSFHDIAIGANAQTATFSSNIAIGASAKASSNNAIALGSNAEASTNQIAMAIGVSSLSTGFTSMAIGNGARSNNNNTTAFGALSVASGISANAFGNRSNATGDSSLAVGNLSTASKPNSIAIGNKSSASGAYSNVFGTNSSTTGDSTIVIGNNLAVSASNVLILGGLGKKIGIGTINPSNKVTIVGASLTDNPLFISKVQPTTTFTSDSVLTINGGIVKAAPYSSLPGSSAWSLTGNTGTNATTNFIGTTDSVDLVLRAANADYIHLLGKSNGISQPGWVGIGTGTPRSRLDIKAIYANKNVITIQNTSTAGYSSVDMYSAGGTLSGTFGFANTAVTNPVIAGRNYFFYYGNDFIMTSGISGGNPDLFIEGSNGNVGINDSTPSEKLEVGGNIRFSGALMPGNNAGTSGQVLTSNGAGVAPTWQNGVTKIKVNTSINVGTVNNNQTKEVQVTGFANLVAGSAVIVNPSNATMSSGWVIAYSRVLNSSIVIVAFYNGSGANGAPGIINYDITVLQ